MCIQNETSQSQNARTLRYIRSKNQKYHRIWIKSERKKTNPYERERITNSPSYG